MAFELKWIGKIDLSEFDKGIKKAKSGVKEASADSKQFDVVNKRLSKTMNDLKGAFMAVGVAGSGMLAGMIAASPELEAIMSDIGLTLEDIFRGLGEHLVPIFDWISKKLEELSEFLQNNPFIENLVAQSAFWGAAIAAVATAFWAVITVLKGVISSLKFVKDLVLTIVKNINKIKIPGLGGLGGAAKFVGGRAIAPAGLAMTAQDLGITLPNIIQKTGGWKSPLMRAGYEWGKLGQKNAPSYEEYLAGRQQPQEVIFNNTYNMQNSLNDTRILDQISQKQYNDYQLKRP